MTAVEIVAVVARAGGSVEAIAGDRVRVHAPAGVLSHALKAAVIERKPELLSLLRRGAIAAKHLLAEGRWPPTLPVCDFLVGHPGERCERCGASWVEHYGSAGD